ncbi:MAG TPA: hypothetical protein VIA63_04495 [Candidatus Limnocylindria bacterium]|jgi:hypothetical protein
MLPTLTFSRRPTFSRRRTFAAVGFGIVALAGLASTVGPPASPGADPSAPVSLAARLSASTWAMAIPAAWLAAPLGEVRVGDSVDLLAVRSGDHPVAIAIAADLRVMTSDERAVVFEVDEESATAIATARATGLLLVPLLRSTR